MRTLLVILLCSNLAFGATEIKRPATDADTGSATWITNNCGIGTYVANSTAGTLARDAAGQATSVTYVRSGSAVSGVATSRVFSGWTASGLTYTALRLNINSFSPGTDPNSAGGLACLAYSLNNGSTWTVIQCNDGWARVTNSITLSVGQDLTKLRVGVCLWGASSLQITAPGNESVQLYDIWTEGDYSGQTGGNGSGAGQASRSQVIIF